MALSFRAEQKSINSIYAGGDEVYVIPNHQRPYSWGRDVCYQLYNDITNAFFKNEDYFIGNIVMAKGLDDKKHPVGHELVWFCSFERSIYWTILTVIK